MISLNAFIKGQSRLRLLVVSLCLSLNLSIVLSAQHHPGHSPNGTTPAPSPVPSPLHHHGKGAKGEALKGSVRTLLLKTAPLVWQNGATVEAPWSVWLAAQYDRQGNQVETIYYSPTGQMREKITTRYDERSNLLDWVQYKEDGSLVRKFIHRYDPDGRKTEINQYGAAGSLIEKQLYLYDNQKNLLALVEYDAAGRLLRRQDYLTASASQPKSELPVAQPVPPLRQVFVTDSQRRTLELISYQGERQLGRVVQTYDSAGQLISAEYYNQAGTLVSRSGYDYDDKGNLLEWRQANAAGELLRRFVYTYDAAGYKTGTAEYQATGKLQKQEIYRYEFDAQGNWIKKTTAELITEAGKSSYRPVEVSYRTLTYY